MLIIYNFTFPSLLPPPFSTLNYYNFTLTIEKVKNPIKQTCKEHLKPKKGFLLFKTKMKATQNYSQKNIKVLFFFLKKKGEMSNVT